MREKREMGRWEERGSPYGHRPLAESPGLYAAECRGLDLGKSRDKMLNVPNPRPERRG